ncbi:ATP-binding protein [Actinomadura mexicana]|uniref:Anti-sigma regulatory factor (Ser/Thr protein kinase) n=1 Tax=Actinomadura mexicana TaxID=134959 RepID=A0A238ZZN0_9ACTN|nr:ATP-binding protein [Actinomadura mexicana]SNR88224.1 Anti-sigma regulatory factor (Ser/Thr protein kinase) [Actinomadura mexicana]
MGEAARHENEMVLKNDLAAVAEVRRFVRLVTGQWDMDDFVPCLVASELVTNALRHASASGDDVTFRIGRTDDGALWLEVQDATCDLPRIQCADTISEVGRGLFIVDQFARCWGIRPLTGNAGKVVFAVLDPT